MISDFQPACDRMEWLDPFYKQVWKKAFEDGIPISGTFELTPRCNFNCKMCYVHLKENEISSYGRGLTAAEWINIAKEAKNTGTTWLCITGGEPLMHPEFCEIWEALCQMGFFLTLQTNASLMTNKIVKLLEKFPPRLVKITLYGTSDDVYEEVCGIKNGFTHVNDGIHTLMSMGIPITLVSTIIQQNQEDVENMAYYAYRHQLPWTLTSNVRPSIRGANKDLSSIRLTEKMNRQKEAEVSKLVETNQFVDPKRKPCTYCKDYRIGYWILWDGNMRFCSFLNKPDISLHQHSFIDAWHQLLDYEEQLEWPEKCKTCEVNHVCLKCAASIATESGDINQVNESYCQHIKQAYKNKQNSNI